MKTLKKVLPAAMMICTGILPKLNAQLKVGANPTTVNSNSVLEMESSNKGVLLPRVALTGTSSAAPLTAFVKGMIVYNTAAAGSGAAAVSPGFYYCDGASWQKLVTAGTTDIKETWRNATTLTASDSSSTNVVFNKGNIGINTGTAAPAAKLEVNGTFKLTDGTQGAGRTLVSDANGLAQWKASAGTTVTAVASLSAAGVSINGTQTGVQTGSYIDLAPGKWLLNVVMLVSNGGSQVPNGQGIWVRSSFSNSASNTTFSTDIIGSTLISGNVAGPMRYGLVNGVLLINNTSAATKRYYYFAYGESMPGTSTGYTVTNFGSTTWGEDQIFAVPVN